MIQRIFYKFEKIIAIIKIKIKSGKSIFEKYFTTVPGCAVFDKQTVDFAS